MLNEPAAMPGYIPLPPIEPLDEHEQALMDLREIIGEYLTIFGEATLLAEDLPAEDQAILARGDSDLVITFSGTLKGDSETLHDPLDQALARHDLFPILRKNLRNSGGNPHIIHIGRKRPAKPKPYPVWPNIVLLLATIISVLLTGTTIAIGEIGLSDPALAAELGGSLQSIAMEMWRGWPYALSILLILIPHEMGHFLMMRRYNTQATWPYFLPAFLISPFGTFGAMIALRESLKNRKVLLDVGAAGPIAGFVVAVPILFIGLATSQVMVPSGVGLVEGNSLLYAAAKFIIFGQFLPTETADVMVNQLAWAGWTGLFVTALNMLPLGQLDGGHILYALFGEKARYLYWPLLLAMLLLAIFAATMWLLPMLILLVVGRYYAVPLDNITPLDRTRQIIGILALVIFVLSFTPTPIYQRGVSGGIIHGITGEQVAIMVTVGLLFLPRWIKR